MGLVEVHFSLVRTEQPGRHWLIPCLYHKLELLKVSHLFGVHRLIGFPHLKSNIKVKLHSESLGSEKTVDNILEMCSTSHSSRLYGEKLGRVRKQRKSIILELGPAPLVRVVSHIPEICGSPCQPFALP